MSVLSFKFGSININLMAMTKGNPNPNHVMSVCIAMIIPKNIIAKCIGQLREEKFIPIRKDQIDEIEKELEK